MAIVINLEEIKKIVADIDVVSAMEEGFVQYSNGNTVVPPVGELLFEKPKGDAHIKYGYIKNDDYYVIKIASGFYDNPKIGLPSSQGLMLLFDQKTGVPKGVLLDEGYLTDIRTAAAGALAAKYFAPKNIKAVGIIGTGIQAKLQLQYLGFHFQDNCWLLKAPVHLVCLADLFKIYPDAVILHMHRDPVHSVPSMCSLASISRSLFSDGTDLAVIPKQWSDLMQKIINHSIEQRSNFNEDQFFDIPYNHLVKDPLGTVEWIYKRIGMECSNDLKIGMKSWLEKSNTRRKKNPHFYSMDQFGLDEKSIQKKFSNYYGRYGEFINAN